MSHYAQLNHPAFPQWMRESLDGAFAAMPQANIIGFEVWADSGYCDETYVNFFGDIYFRWKDEASQNIVTEDEKDFIPWVRRLERNAKDIWNLFPVKLEVDDGDARINGNYYIQAKEDSFSYKFEDDNEDMAFVIEAVWNGSSWEIDERIEMPFYEGAMSSILVNLQEAIESYDVDELNLESYPEVVSFEEIDGIYVFHLKHGELMRCQKTSEYKRD